MYGIGKTKFTISCKVIFYNLKTSSDSGIKYAIELFSSNYVKPHPHDCINLVTWLMPIPYDDL